ncbi:MAG: FAD-binding oxidoreductase [Pseudomonadales bacterium]|nr:FAD-binding oxidoreductase [Pseudomonadales bacterium]MDP4640391.1 FAD-binding oxidoreductase [Pseudomonadales bacterium]MDP4875360.1 FAD-binding oxidoreductase [Pseudomonadales bacterium]MDP4910794.1 FAD-binding oxidoreductase [Pseudomonadales bacterium]MDP5059199.1 FAD-binding oxidoreductase [Pseudomonadales bacterium]
MEVFDIIIIGAGIAGASVAAQVSDQARVLLLEKEERPGYHATGRSAAAYIPSYGSDNAALRLLTAASRAFLKEPPHSFQVPSIMRQRGLLTLYPTGSEANLNLDWQVLRQQFSGITRVETDFIRQQIPAVRDEYASAGLYESDVYDLDVHALHEGYLRTLKAQGGKLITRVTVDQIISSGNGWQVNTSTASYSAPLLVNAAGAWADDVAALAGVSCVGLVPKRRTAILVEPPQGCDVAEWPLVMSSTGSFYFKPDAGLLLVSPADEHATVPCDAQPEELDIAYAVDFAEQALDLRVKQVKHSWAGLRSFVEDSTPVIGFAPNANGFFWLAGQGGHGIQTAPATARLAASLLLAQGLPDDLQHLGFDPAWVSPTRLLNAQLL